MTMRQERKEEAIRTACALCPSTCGLSAHVSNGVITKITPGDFPDPKFRGACEKGLLSHHWAYHPDRLRYPMRRAGKRGEDKWQRISWEEALDDIAAKLKDIAQKHGPTSIAWSVIDYPTLKQREYLRLLSLTKGTFVENWGFGDLAAPNADFVTFGNVFSAVYASTLKDPKLALIWGSNPFNTKPSLMAVLTGGKQRICKTVTIDPRYTATASRSDEYIQIRPGTDAALALGMTNVILEKGLENRKFIIENTVGPLLVRADNGRFLQQNDYINGANKNIFMVWDKLSAQAQRFDIANLEPALFGEYFVNGTVCHPAFQLLVERIRDYTPEIVSHLTDIPAETIKRLAMDYATQKPAAIHRGYGMQRTFYGDIACRAIHTLSAITGNLNMDFSSCVDAFLLMLGGDYKGGGFSRIPIMMLYDAISKGTPFPVKAFCSAGHNFINQMPNANRIINELFPQLELIFTCDLFMTATAKFSDYVLPAASFLESTDIVSFPSYFVQLQEKVIEPLHESKSDFWIAQELGRRMGFGDYFEKKEEESIIEVLASVYTEEEGVTLEKLKQGPVAQKTRKLPLKTPTKRIEFYVESLKQFGQELPVYLEPLESLRQDKAKKYSLSLLTPHSRYRIHSMLANVPELQKFDPEPCLEINPADAKARNISDGDPVYVYNDRGCLKVKAKLTADIKPGVVSLDEGWWPEQYMEGHHNELTHEAINTVQKFILGPNAAYCDVLVEVSNNYTGC